MAIGPIGDPRRRARRLLEDARAIAQLGASRSASLRIFLVYLCMPLKHRIAALHGRPVALRILYRGVERTIIISDASEMLTLKEVLLEDEYDLSEFSEPGTILDLGANIGVATVLFRAHYPRAHIVAVEPDPNTFRKLERNVGADPGVTTINAAVAASSGPVSFVSDGMSWASRLAEPGERSPVVEGVTLDELAERFDLGQGDMVKIDVEGAEYQVLAAARTLSVISVLIGEVHAVAPGAPERLFEELERRGWRHARELRRMSFSMIRTTLP